MLNKADLRTFKKAVKPELANSSESSDYKRGLRRAALMIYDILIAKGKNDTAATLMDNIG